MKALLFALLLTAIQANAQQSGWQVQQLPGSDTVIQVKAVDSRIAWALGVHATVFRTTDGGTTWKSVGGGSALTGRFGLCIEATSDSIAFVGGVNWDVFTSTPPPNDSTFIWHTTDAGGTWSLVFTQLHGAIDEVRMITATEGIGLGDPVGGKWVIIRTTDSGLTWSRIASEPVQVGSEIGLFRSLSTYGPRHIWFGTLVLGTNETVGLYRSTDAGLTWSRATIAFVYGVFSLSYSDSLHGLCSENSVARTTDGGVTWIPTGLPDGGDFLNWFPTVSVCGGRDFWAAVDADVYRSTDKGVTWSLSYPGSLGGLSYCSFAEVGDSVAGWVTSVGSGVAAYHGPSTDVSGEQQIPGAFALGQNYPNPFNPTTVISYQLSAVTNVRLVVCDLLGREVAVLVNERKAPGNYEVRFDGAGLASGVYLYRLTAGDFVQTHKMILVR